MRKGERDTKKYSRIRGSGIKEKVSKHQCKPKESKNKGQVQRTQERSESMHWHKK